jgi:ATP-dependent RNA helicase SUPV3L1/SUV3
MKLDKLDGNVDSLSNRIANVRTWSYVSNKINWVENQNYWIEKTKILEDRFLIDCMKNLPKHLLIKEQVFLQED